MARQHYKIKVLSSFQFVIKWPYNEVTNCCSVAFLSDSLWPPGVQHDPKCPSPSPRVCSNSCPLSQWCHPTISSFIVPFFSSLQSFPASGPFPMSQFFFFFFSQFFPSGGQTIGASASVSVLPRNIQGWFSLGLTGLISLQSKGLSRVFSSTTVLWHQLLGTQPFRLSSFHILDFSLYFFTLSFNL